MSMKDWRERHGLTQGAVEALFGVSRRSIVSWEAGEKELPAYMRYAMRGYDAEQGAPPAAADDAQIVARLVALEECVPANLEARLNALEAAAMPRLPRFAPDVQALQDLETRRAAKLAELEAQEADQATVVPMHPYRPPQLTPAEEAARKARRAAAKAAHIANGEPWDE